MNNYSYLAFLNIKSSSTQKIDKCIHFTTGFGNGTYPNCVTYKKYKHFNEINFQSYTDRFLISKTGFDYYLCSVIQLTHHLF